MGHVSLVGAGPGDPDLLTRRALVRLRAADLVLYDALVGEDVLRLARRAQRYFVGKRAGRHALREAGVPFEIVPGVSSLVAGPALAGIPVTHRGLATSVLFITGHDDGVFAATVSGVPARGTTLVIAMGYANRAALAGRLISAGWAPETPAALIAGASLKGQQVWRGSLSALAAGQGACEGDQPALIVVGAVVGLAVLGQEPAAGAAGADDGIARRSPVR
jgi:siroheme synthase